VFTAGPAASKPFVDRYQHHAQRVDDSHQGRDKE
jgi:hypothetical protein